MESSDEKETIDITVYAVPGDFDTFRKYFSKGV
jgi:hypothetical protein